MEAKAIREVWHAADLDGHRGPSGALAPWLRLILGLAILGFFIFGLSPVITTGLPGYERLRNVIQEHQINAGSFYYTGVEQTAEGEKYLRERLQ